MPYQVSKPRPSSVVPKCTSMDSALTGLQHVRCTFGMLVRCLATVVFELFWVELSSR